MLVNLRALFGVILDIMLLRRGPEHLPASPALLIVIAIVHIVAHSVADHVFLAPFRPGAPPGWPGQIVMAAFMMVWFRVALQLAGKPERFVQTMSAVFIASLFAVLLFPLLAALMPYALAAQKTPGEAAPAPGSLLLLTGLVGFWILAVLARIVKAAFEWTWPASIVFLVVSIFGVPLLLLIVFSQSVQAA